MKRPITITTGQFGDMSLEELCKLTSQIVKDAIRIVIQDGKFTVVQ